MRRYLSTFLLQVVSCMMLWAQAQQLPENVVYSERTAYGVEGAQGRSYNFAPTFFIYPDQALDESGAKALVKELGMADILKEHHGSVFVVNPTGKKYDQKTDFDAFVKLFNVARSGNLKVIGLGEGASFINTGIVPQAHGHIAGVLTYNGKKASLKKGDYKGVPSYVAGRTAKTVAREYEMLNEACKDQEPLLQVTVNESEMSLSALFQDAWDKTLCKAYRFNNYKHTHYEGCQYGQYGTYELEPYVEWAKLGLKRNVILKEQRTGLPIQWYEYWPEGLDDSTKVPAGSVPVMVLLHGNTNDPRTQAETSGFLELAVKERFFVVEMEWQGSAMAAAMGHDGVESTIYELLRTYPQLDASRVYAEGLSAGSMTATSLGIKKSHVFAAVGGHSGGIMNGQGLQQEALQKRGAVEVPYCSVLGTADNVVRFIKPDNWKGNGYLNAWNAYETMNGLDIISDLDFSKDPLFGFNLQDRETIKTDKGDGITIETGQLKKNGVPMLKIVAVVDYGHWNFKPTAQIMWDFFKQFSRDQKTMKLVYNGK